MSSADIGLSASLDARHAVYEMKTFAGQTNVILIEIEFPGSITRLLADYIGSERQQQALFKCRFIF